MRLVVLAIALAACDPQPAGIPDAFCSGEAKLEIDGLRLRAFPFCHGGDGFEIGFEYTLDPSGFVDWTRHSLSVATDAEGVPKELRLMESDPAGGRSVSYLPGKFSGEIGVGDTAEACLEIRVGVPGRVAPVVIRMFATVPCEEMR